MVDPGRVGEPPAGRLQVEAELDRRSASVAARHVRAGAPAGQLGQVRQVGQLTEHEPSGLGEVLAGHRPDAGGRRALIGPAVAAVARRVAEMVAEPTTREPS